MHQESSPSQNPSTTVTFQLKAVRPVGNLEHLEKSLESVPGVESVEIDRAEKVARVEHHQANIKELLRVLGVNGYDARMH